MFFKRVNGKCQFINIGGGHVVIHAGGSSYNEWQEYHQIAAYWGSGTGHGSHHHFTVKSTGKKHPIVQSVEPFETFDELWHGTHFPPKNTVLMTAFSSKDKGGSGKDEPVLTVNHFGQGQCVNLMLGHDVVMMENQNFQRLLRHSVIWAATGTVDYTDYSFKETHHSIALVNGNKTVWQINYGKDVAKPYFHPISLVDGTVLTWQAPKDHPWHHGLWFCWKFINGVNYWEEDRKIGKSKGATDWTNVDVQKQDDRSAQITMDMFYHEPGKPILLKERRTMLLSAPYESGSYTIDWESTFTAVADKVVLDRTPLPWEQGGKTYGGYTGLLFRAREGVQDARYIGTFGSQPPLSNGNYRFKDIAIEYSGRINNKVFGVAILDHPDNLNFPSPWYLNDGNPMDFFSPALLCYGPHTMSKDETLVLKYRIIIHPSRWNAEMLKHKHKLFIVD